MPKNKRFGGATFDRRVFLVGTGAALAMSPGKALFAKNAAYSRTYEHGHPLREFAYGDVRFASGPHLAQLEQCHEILMGLDEDGLMRPFRLAAGLPAPGNDLGGWYRRPLPSLVDHQERGLHDLSRCRVAQATAPGHGAYRKHRRKKELIRSPCECPSLHSLEMFGDLPITPVAEGHRLLLPFQGL